MAPTPEPAPASEQARSRKPASGAPLLELVAVMDRLRSPGGCPWDAEQTHRSLATYLLEETYEALEAIDCDDAAGMREEFGDVLLQVVFHSRIAAEDPVAPWTIDDVAAGIRDKLVARHPHVFADQVAHSAAEVEANWQARKVAEKSRESVLDGIPAALPALVLAQATIVRAARGRVGIPPGSAPAREAAARALDALDDGGPQPGPGDAAQAYGDLLLALVALGAERGLDAEAALRARVRGFGEAIRAAEGAPQPR